VCDFDVWTLDSINKKANKIFDEPTSLNCVISPFRSQSLRDGGEGGAIRSGKALPVPFSVIHKLLRILGQHPQPEGYFLAQLNNNRTKFNAGEGENSPKRKVWRYVVGDETRDEGGV
jgi:hypothetical protein